MSANEPYYDPQEIQDAEDAKKEREREYEARLHCVREIVKTGVGRAYLWRLLEDCHVFQSTFVSGEPELTAFQEGERARGLRILSDIQSAAPEKWLQMIEEASHGRSQRDA